MNSLIPDLDSLRIEPAAVTRPAPRTKAARNFLRGPIPLPWLIVAAKLPGRSLHVGLALWYYAGMRSTHQINFPIRWLKTALNMERHAAYRGLRHLERADLVSVARHRGHASIVTLLEVSS
jgi:hypothetical protein